MQRSDVHAGMETDGLLADPCIPVITGEKDCPAQIYDLFQHLTRRKRLFIAVSMKQLMVRPLVREHLNRIIQDLAMLCNPIIQPYRIWQQK